MRTLVSVCLLLLLSLAAGPALAAPRLGTLPLPGTPEFVSVARDVIDVEFSIDPSQASGAGLFDDARRVPGYAASHVAELASRLDDDMRKMRAMPWRSWEVDRQIDFRWIYACAETAQRALTVEHVERHRSAQWLEPLANNLINLVTYAPHAEEVQADVLERVPAMIDEMRAVCVHPTSRDVTTSRGLIKGLLRMCGERAATARLRAARQRAATVLQRYDADLAALVDLPEFVVIGADNYAWRLQHALLLPWTPDQLLALAVSEKQRVEARMAELKPQLEPAPAADAKVKRLAADLTRDSLLGLYDRIEENYRTSLLRSGVVSVPPGVGPIRARETPDAMVPLTGDGGSMNPPTAIGGDNVGWWNVEHFHKTWTMKQREAEVIDAVDYRETGMGPYAAHEGLPGHHLQLSIARLESNPLRKILSDGVQNEGWALYAEDMFWRSGGLGNSKRAEYDTLASYMHRIKRVYIDVNVERGNWTLQQAADFRALHRPDEDILRAINWPTQLIDYFAGKQQILALRDDYRRKMGARYSDREFHDALLRVGSVPLVMARARLLGEPVPGL
jgi:uncharacterized protein (DUF885 family)